MFRLLVPSLALAAVVVASNQQSLPDAALELHGRVIDAISGRPIAGASVEAYAQNTSRMGVLRAETDGSGAFALTEVRAGEYRLGASKPGYLSSEYGRKRANGGGIPYVQSATQPNEVVTIRMWQAAAMTGRVTDERGRPAVEVPVSAFAVDDSGGRRIVGYGPSAITNDLGEYALSNVVPGRYIVVVPARLETRRVQPTVYNRDDPVTYSSTVLLGDHSKAALVVPAGLLPPAPAAGRRAVYVSSFHGGSRQADAAVVDVSAGAERDGVDIQLQLLPAFRVSGIITGPAGPVEGATLFLRPLDWGGPARQVTNITAFAASDGAFTFISVPPGRYVLTARRKVPAPGLAALASNGSTSLPMDDVIMSDPDDLYFETSIAMGDSDIADLALTMQRGTTVSGRVLFSGGGTITGRSGGLSIALLALDRVPLESGPVGGVMPPGRDGVMRFSLAAHPDEYIVVVPRGRSGWWLESARVDGRDVGVGPFRIGTDEVEMDVTFTQAPTELSGAVVDSDGRPISDANVLVFPANPSLWRGLFEEGYGREDTRIRRLRTGRSAYAVTGLAPAEYLVAAVDEADMDGWPSEPFLERLRASAVRVQLFPGEHRAQPLVLKPSR